MNSARDHSFPREPAHFAKKADPGTIALSRAECKTLKSPLLCENQGASV